MQMDTFMEHDEQGASAPTALSEQQIKQKYGKVYRIGITLKEDDENELECAYHFKRPSLPSYDRYVKNLSKSGATKTSSAFMLDAVIEEDRERLVADMETYPGIAITIGGKLTEILGLTADANLKKL